MVYQHDPSSKSDEAFEAGRIDHLVPGNDGRLLDARRTPIRLNRVRPEVRMFQVEVLAFEDRGARWDVPFEDVVRFQFRRGAQRVQPALAAEYQTIAARLDRRLQLAAEPETRTQSELLVRAEQESAAAMLRRLPDVAGLVRRSLGHPRDGGSRELTMALTEYLGARGVLETDVAVARAHASNPNAGEEVLGHEMALAGLGLVSYDGRALRDPASWDGPWSEDKRAAHIIARLGFVRALFHVAEIDHVILYRGFAAERPVRQSMRHSLISATFDRAVAMEHFEGNERSAVAGLYRQRVPVTRLFMTYLETDALNHPFREAEAILLRADGDELF